VPLNRSEAFDFYLNARLPRHLHDNKKAKSAAMNEFILRLKMEILGSFITLEIILTMAALALAATTIYEYTNFTTEENSETKKESKGKIFEKNENLEKLEKRLKIENESFLDSVKSYHEFHHEIEKRNFVTGEIKQGSKELNKFEFENNSFYYNLKLSLSDASLIISGFYRKIFKEECQNEQQIEENN
jgi:hypothetical protein